MKFIYTILFCLVYTSSHGQVNIESFRNAATKSGFYGEANANIQFQKGNVNSKTYEIKKDLHYKFKKHHVLLKGSLSKGYQDEILYRNNAFSHFRYTLMLHDFLGYEIFTQTQYDEFKDLKLRQLNGIGIRLEKQLSEKYNFKIAFGTGIMSDYEQLSNSATTNVRSTSYISILKSFSNSNSSFISVVSYYQPLLFNHKDYRINNELNLRSSIIDEKKYKVGINTSLVYLYDTVPAEKIEKSDIILKSGLVISW